MPLPYELSERAERDIQDIVAYTFENFGRAQVDSYVDGLFNTFSILSENPELGHPLDFDQTIRQYVYRMHLVYYQLRDDVIRIAHIRHTSMKPPPISAIMRG